MIQGREDIHLNSNFTKVSIYKLIVAFNYLLKKNLCINSLKVTEVVQWTQDICKSDEGTDDLNLAGLSFFKMISEIQSVGDNVEKLNFNALLAKVYTGSTTLENFCWYLLKLNTHRPYYLAILLLYT
jgi:hypothetical protein